MEYTLPGRKEFFMLIDGKESYTVADIEALPEGERAEPYTFTDEVKTGIYEDFAIDFGEYLFKDFDRK